VDSGEVFTDKDKDWANLELFFSATHKLKLQ